MRTRKLIDSETEESETEGPEESTGETGGEIIAFESKTLDYINERNYHGLVGMERESDCSSKRKRQRLQPH